MAEETMDKLHEINNMAEEIINGLFDISYKITVGLVTEGWTKDDVKGVLNAIDNEMCELLVIEESLKAIDTYLSKHMSADADLAHICIYISNLNAMQTLIDILEEMKDEK